LTRTAPDPALVADIEFLKKKLATEMLKNQQLSATAESIRQLEEFDVDKKFDSILADVVVASDASPWRGSLTIARGSLHGIKPGQLVVYQQYLVGRVHQVGPMTSRVLLATDPAFKIGAVTLALEDKAAARQVGLAQGSGGSKVLLRWISETEQVRQGQFVATTYDPISGVPKGLIIGRVVSLERTRSSFPEIVVEPAVQSRNLEYVMILSPKETK
jgi:rod shape-determining protein MreC